jgi:hypothetical protein
MWGNSPRRYFFLNHEEPTSFKLTHWTTECVTNVFKINYVDIIIIKLVVLTRSAKLGQ